MDLLNKLEEKIKEQGALIVSCQPVPDSPMDKPEIVAAMAKAAELSGAVAVRIEGIKNIEAVRAQVNIPIVGIIKRDLCDSPVRITPFVSDVDDLANAGASIIAFDGTARNRPASTQAILNKIHSLGLLAMADCSTIEDGLACHEIGCDFIGTTLSGYTGNETPVEPDLALVAKLSQHGCKVIAEGRYNSPQQAARAIEQGAWCVTVGSAITRIEYICQWYCQALLDAKETR